MKVSDLGEFGLIDLLAGIIDASRDGQQTSWRKLLLGIGDDTAAWHGDAAVQLATVDSFIQDVHFSLETASWRDVGWKALAVNLSDIAAMGGQPRYALVSLAVPGHTEVKDVSALYQGMVELAGQSGVAIVGGNTSSAPIVAITVTVLGTAAGSDNRLLVRSAAGVGDKVAVTGHLGTAAAGREMFDKRVKCSARVAAIFSEALLRPCTRITEGQLLIKEGAKAAIDISDGLIADLGHICQASRVGARLDVDRVPVAPDVKACFGDRALGMALAGGDDYELLFTATGEVVASIREAASCPVTVIGEIVDGGRVGEVSLFDKQGKPFNLSQTGWEHFTA